jgi:hypothetical protein
MARKITIGEMQEAAMLGYLPEGARQTDPCGARV